MTAPSTGRSGRRSILSPTLTPRTDFQLTRRLVGVTRWPLILLTSIYTINVADQFLLPAMFPLLQREFTLSNTSLGLLAGSYLISVTLFTVPFGVLADRYTRTRIIAWGTVAWGLTMIFTGSAQGFAMLLVGRILLGMWDPCDNPTSQSLLADYYPVNQRSKVMGVYQLGTLVGFAVLPIAGVMGQAWGWRAAFYFFAIPAFVVGALAWRLQEPVRGTQDRKHQRLREADHVEPEPEHGGGFARYMELFRVRTFVAVIVAAGAGNLFFGGIGIWTPLFLIRYHDMSIAAATTSLSVVAIGGVVGVIGSGHLADYLAATRYPAARIAVAGFARLLAVPLFVLAFTISFTALALLCLMLGALFLVAGIPPANAARHDVLHPRLRGRGTSLDAVAQSVAGAASPVLFGILADAFDLRLAFVILVPMSGVAGLALLTAGLASYAADERAVRDQVRREHLEALGLAPESTTEALAATESDAVGGPDQFRDDAPMLQIERLDFSYGPVQVLFGVDMTVPRGGCHAIVGRNGVGKTTLLANIAGLLDAQGGQMFYRGVDLVGTPPEQRAKLGITLVTAGSSTFPSLSVRDNLMLGVYPFLKDQDLAASRADAVLDLFPPLQQRLDQQAGTLSGGEQQMVALGRALMAGPDLLLIDELSMGLAPMITASLLEVLEQVLAFGTTVLLVEQSIDVALTVADDVFFMDRGVVSQLGPASELDAGMLTRRLLAGSE